MKESGFDKTKGYECFEIKEKSSLGYEKERTRLMERLSFLKSSSKKASRVLCASLVITLTGVVGKSYFNPGNLLDENNRNRMHHLEDVVTKNSERMNCIELLQVASQHNQLSRDFESYRLTDQYVDFKKEKFSAQSEIKDIQNSSILYSSYNSFSNWSQLFLSLGLFLGIKSSLNYRQTRKRINGVRTEKNWLENQII